MVQSLVHCKHLTVQDMTWARKRYRLTVEGIFTSMHSAFLPSLSSSHFPPSPPPPLIPPTSSRLGTGAEYTFYTTLLTMLQQVVQLVAQCQLDHPVHFNGPLLFPQYNFQERQCRLSEERVAECLRVVQTQQAIVEVMWKFHCKTEASNDFHFDKQY